MLRHPDNLAPEGEFEKRQPAAWQPSEKQPAVRHADNLRPEGDIQLDRKSWAIGVGERAAMVRHEDNLKMEGRMEVRTAEAWRPGERPSAARPVENLRPEGEFARREATEWRAGERAEMTRQADNLTIQGGYMCTGTIKIVFITGFWSRSSPEPGYLAEAGAGALARPRIHLKYLFNNSQKLQRNSKIMFSFTRIWSRLRIKKFPKPEPPQNRLAPKPCFIRTIAGFKFKCTYN